MFISRNIKWFFLIAICFGLQVLFPSACLSNNKIDSLLAVIKTSKEDTHKLNALISLSSYLFNSDPEKSYMYSTQTLELAQKLHLKPYIRGAYQNIAAYYYYKDDIKHALEYTKKELPLINPKNKHALAKIYNSLSLLAHAQNDFVNAMDYSQKALQIAEQLKDSTLIANILGDRGIMYGGSDYSTAFSYIFQSLKINEAQNDTQEMATNYSNISILYDWQGNNNKAIYYCQLSLKLAKKLDDKFLIASSLNELGIIYDNNKNYDSAINYIQQALSIFQQLGNMPRVGSSIGDIAMIYSDYGQYDKAIGLMNQAIEISKQDADKSFLGASYEDLGDIYTKTKNYDTAVAYLNKGVNISKTIGAKNAVAYGLLDLAKCYQGLNNYKLAFNILMQCKQLNDSILNNETVQKTSELDARYHFDEKEKEIALLNKDEQIQELEIKKQTLLKYSFMTGSVLMFVLFILFLFIYRNYRIRQSLKLQQLRNKIAIDLHDDIGSTLRSISIFSELARQQSQEVAPMLDQIIKNSRQMLESMADIVWTIKPENDNFENIINRMKSFAYQLLRAKHIDFEFNADDSIGQIKLPMDVRKNLYLIFKEALNNIIKYSEADRALFSISSNKNELKMLIRDNGKGFDINSLTEGNGLKNMQKRASEMGAKFLIKSEYGIGTSIQLLINFAL